MSFLLCCLGSFWVLKENKEEKKEEEEEKEEKKDDKKEGVEAPPPEIILKVDMHCEACARKIARALKGFEGPLIYRTHLPSPLPFQAFSFPSRYIDPLDTSDVGTTPAQREHIKTTTYVAISINMENSSSYYDVLGSP